MAHLSGAVSAITTGFATTSMAVERIGNPGRLSRRTQYRLSGSPTSKTTGAAAITTSVTAEKTSARDTPTRPCLIR